MGEKIEVSDEELLEISKKVQSQESTYAKEAQRLGMDRTTLSKKVRDLRARLKEKNNTMKSNTEDNKTIGEDPKVTPEAPEAPEVTEKITFTLSKHLIRALKLKAVNEGKRTIDVLREALNSYIEPKYFKDL